MTDDALKDLVLKHDSEISLLANSIENQSKSIESLVSSNSETNKRLEEISKYLAKQAVFDTKLEAMDKDLSDNFKRVHARIDTVESTQNSNRGCKSVQLLGKDIGNLEKEYVQMAGTIGEVKINTDKIEKHIEAMPSQVTVRWVIGLLLVYTISFGSYMVSELQHDEIEITKVMEHMK